MTYNEINVGVVRNAKTVKACADEFWLKQADLKYAEIIKDINVGCNIGKYHISYDIIDQYCVASDGRNHIRYPCVPYVMKKLKIFGYKISKNKCELQIKWK